MARQWVQACLQVLFLCGTGGSALAADWIRAGLTTKQPVWGLPGGLQFAIAPGGFGGAGGGPRGLIRVGSPVLPEGAYTLVNFIAVEPVVSGRKGFSELEPSRFDGVAGKRFWAGDGSAGPAAGATLNPGRVSTVAPGVEQLAVTLRIEQFNNGAHVRVLLSQRSDAPDEIQLTVHAEPDSARLDECILTATMGNLARTRRLWLRDETVGSLRLYANHRGDGFADHARFPLKRLWRRADGDVLVAVTTDESTPTDVFPFPGTERWHYGGSKVTQYWRKPAGDVGDDLEAVVNARLTYWQSQQPIPGGVAFENFELRERFREGQSASFGITRKTPADLGFEDAKAQSP